MSDLTLLDFGEGEFQARPELNSHLAWESFIALAKHPSRVLVIDRTLKRREMKSGFLLALSWMMSRRLLEWTNKKRVGILFPPGIGGYIANLAVVFAGKVPVNLNFTLGPASSEACLARADIDCILSTERMRAKIPNFPWPEAGVVDLVEELKRLPKAKTIAILTAIKATPAKVLAKLLKVPSVGGDTEAGLLFTSGSSGEPKGVVLTHRNILGNCLQIDATRLLPVDDKIIANLPIFHSFGFTVTLWYPLLRGCAVVTVPSPLEFKKVAEAIEAESATILIGTPTFFKPYIRHVAPEKLKSLKYAITGAEKTPAGFAELWEERFGGLYLEGYGLTETSPVVSINLPHTPEGFSYVQSEANGAKRGSVGLLMPGHAARILNPDTMEPLPVTDVGLLLLKGPNIFGGYLNDSERTAEVMDDGWFITGDLARFDDEGYLFIEGRLSRFSKIAGEMVPHGTVEQALVEAFGLLNSEVPMLAVGSRPDAAKGEALVLLSVMDLELSDVRAKLSEAGYSNLWVPKVIKRVDEIPALATGKLDLRGIKTLCEAE
ncbi:MULTISPECIES: AMP-binding protein [unclassified Lentimonas]|uniref:AMP-binding protein n=1 Tax=unclassified Lentimonas TaxID=2630993 RepID=UPI0013242597|nr:MULTISPECIES: AMP-binding protein [unclassified Lentimonas]CAA6691178.1 Putative 2-acylglycerophosphoethanolamine acyltransferase / acyl-acyl carrier protein synthetase (EC [Lentimonas sp. CC19]CAA6694734.1 Putative 2-acylglycerophosphoethanolamine acyltransferase / acyl-acyl carrier protein synthetase (EC [Lentimonas sp. CC10]CAA7071558.1 Putative 2-acylglycerophosphoethanolamine acyltransferase / acyl-acyl carrier protein synthetase (EC [Lentimonas sp. CC11]